MHRLPEFLSGIELWLSTVMICLIKHPSLASFPSLSHFPTLLLVFSGIASHIKYCHLNPYLRVFFWIQHFERTKQINKQIIMQWSPKHNILLCENQNITLLSEKVYYKIYMCTVIAYILTTQKISYMFLNVHVCMYVCKCTQNSLAGMHTELIIVITSEENRTGQEGQKRFLLK